MKTLNPLKSLTLIATCFSFALSVQHVNAGTYNFDTEANYNSLIQTGRAGTASWSASGGIGNSGSILVDNTTNANTPKYFTESARISTEAPITLSLYFQWTTPTLDTTQGYSIVFGIGTNAENATLTPYVTPYNESTTGTNREEIYIGIRTNGISDQVNLVSGNVSGLANTTSYSSTDYGTLTLGDWYYMTATITPLEDSSGFDMTLGLSNATNGEVGDLIFSGLVTSTNTALLNGTVNSFFATRSTPWSGATHIDNVVFASAIPEPGVIGLLMSFGILLLLSRKVKEVRKARRNSI